MVKKIIIPVLFVFSTGCTNLPEDSMPTEFKVVFNREEGYGVIEVTDDAHDSARNMRSIARANAKFITSELCEGKRVRRTWENNGVPVETGDNPPVKRLVLKVECVNK